MEPTIPFPIGLKPDIDRYAYHLGASDKRLNVERHMVPIHQMAQDLGRLGVKRWSEMKPLHYEAILRSREPVVRDSDLPEVKATVAEVRKMDSFVDFLSENGTLPVNPMDTLVMTKAGVVRKYSETAPAFVPVVEEFLGRRRNGRDPNISRGALTRHTGHLLELGVKRFDEVNETHIELFAKTGVDRAMAREGNGRKGAIGRVRDDTRALENFYEFTRKKGVTERNPATGMIVTIDGRVFSQREVPARLRNAVEGYIADSTPGTTWMELGATHLREFMLHCCGEHGVRNLSEIKPGHYDEYLRTMWGRYGYEPDYVLRRHNQVSRMMGALVARPPTEGFGISMAGKLTSPLGRSPTQLPQADGFGVPQLARLDDLPDGFRTDAKHYLQGRVTSNKAAVLRTAGSALIRATKCFRAAGATSFRDARQEHVEQFGASLLAEVSPTSAHLYLNQVRRLFHEIEERGLRDDDPSTGFVIAMTGKDKGVLRRSPRVAPELDQQSGIILRTLYPHAVDGRSRQAFREALRPLFGEMTRDGLTDLKDITSPYLTKFDRRQERLLGEGSTRLRDMRMCAYQVLGVALPDRENPAKGLLANARDIAEPRLSQSDETTLHIPRLAAPTTIEERKPARRPVAPGE